MNMKVMTSFVIGAITGGAITFAYLTKIKKIEYNVIEPEESEKTEEVKYESQNDDPSYITPNKDNDILTYYKEKGASDESIIDYRKFAKIEDKDEDIISIDRIDPAKVVKNRGVKFEISEDDAMMREDYDAATIAIYDDGTVVDETSGKEIIYDPEEIDDFIGTEHMDKFIEDDSKDSMYIENAMYGTVYEVYKRHENYTQDYIDETSDEE